MCSTRLAGNRIRKNYPKIAICAPSHNIVDLYFPNKGTYRQPEKNLLNSNISSTSPPGPHNVANFGPLTAEIGSGVWGTPANFNDFRILASLLQRRRSTEVNQTLHYVWPSPGLVHCIYIFRGSCPVTGFCYVQNSLCVQLLSYLILAVFLYGTPVVGVSQSLRRGRRNRGRHLYSAGRPSRTLGISPHSSSFCLL